MMKNSLPYCVCFCLILFSLAGCEKKPATADQDATQQAASKTNQQPTQESASPDSKDQEATTSEQLPASTESTDAKDGASVAETKAVLPTTAAGPDNTVRFATFNVAMNRNKQGQLKDELESGESRDGAKIAEVIQIVRPDVLLLCEFDYDEQGAGIKAFQEKYLGVPQNGQKPIAYKHVYFETVNTGQPTGKDINGDGNLHGPDDAFGFGQFPGKYAMVVLSNLEIDRENVRTFQNFLWKDMPNCLWPIDPATDKPFYSDDIKEVFRLSSKSHWDIPVKVGDRKVHFLTSHPTPPVFDKAEDRNGCRNHDEIRMFADYVSGKADYLYDDGGKKGGLASTDHFIIAGDLNADPFDGDSRDKAINQLLELPNVDNSFTPASEGGSYYADIQAGINIKHKGEDKHDTSDFRNDKTVGNMRIDYVLPSTSLKVESSGVFWPKPSDVGGEAALASDHRLVWIDIVR